MFECTLEQGEILKQVIGAVGDLVENANFDCTTEGVSLQAMDSSHVSLVSLFLGSEGFVDYRADRQVALGINMVNLAKILKCSGSKDSISLKANDDGDTIQFVFESEDKDRVSTFDMKLMDIDSEHLGIPETDYKCVVRMSSSEFARICKDMATIGDTVAIAASKEGVKFSVSGDSSQGEMTLKNDSTADKNSDDAVLIELEESVNQTFALRYLNFFTKATPLSKTVSLSMSPEVPLVVEYKVENLGHIRYYLAPKIEDE